MTVSLFTTASRPRNQKIKTLMFIYTTIVSEDGQYHIVKERDGAPLFEVGNEVWDNPDWVSARVIPFVNGKCDEELSTIFRPEDKEELRRMFDLAINKGWFKNTAAW